MGDQQQSEFEALLLRKEDRVGVSLLLIIAWISASGGEIDKQASDDLRKVAAAGRHCAYLPLIIELAKEGNSAALQLACECIQQRCRGSRATLMMELVIGVSNTGRELPPATNHILRFLSDLLSISQTALISLYDEAAGRKLPGPSDVSGQEYWQKRPRSRRAKEHAPHPTQLNQVEDLPKEVDPNKIIGVPYEASKAEIKIAFKKLAQIHIPSRYKALGDEAVAAAAITQERIQNAYRTRLRHA